MKSKRTFGTHEMKDYPIREKSKEEYQVQEQQYTLESDERTQCRECLQKQKKKKMLFFSYIWALGKIFTIERSIVHLGKKTVKN